MLSILNLWSVNRRIAQDKFLSNDLLGSDCIAITIFFVMTAAEWEERMRIVLASMVDDDRSQRWRPTKKFKTLALLLSIESQYTCSMKKKGGGKNRVGFIKERIGRLDNKRSWAKYRLAVWLLFALNLAKKGRQRRRPQAGKQASRRS